MRAYPPGEVSKFVKPDYVIIGEATTTTVKIGQRGRAEVVVETEGKPPFLQPAEGCERRIPYDGGHRGDTQIVPNTHPIWKGDTGAYRYNVSALSRSFRTACAVQSYL